VNNGSSLIAGGLLSLSYHRYELADPTISAFPMETIFVTQAPRPLPQIWNVFRPFKLSLWFTLLASTITVTFAIHFLLAKERKTCEDSNLATWVNPFKVLVRQSN
jgi:heme/copper-type cytochrome/quinol oxidase subunit 3